MDHQFLNVDCHPSTLPRPTPHPSYTGSSGGTYSLDVRQSPDGTPLVNQFNPYRLSSSTDGVGHSSLSSSQFAAFDSFYKAYQSAYGQNTALAAAGAMFSHPSYRFENPLLPADQQLMLQAGFLQYPHLGMFPNPSLYTGLPGSSGAPRYPNDYFGQNLPGLSSYPNSSKFPPGPDITPAQAWLGLDRSASTSLLSSFIATSLPESSLKEEHHNSDSLLKKTSEKDLYDRAGYLNHHHHQQQQNNPGHHKLTRQPDEANPSRHHHHHHHHHSSTSSSLTSSLIQNDSYNRNHRDEIQKRGNGEVSHTGRRLDDSFGSRRGEEKKSDSSAQNSSKELSQMPHGQKRSASSSTLSQTIPKSNAFSSVHRSDVSSSNDESQNYPRYNSNYLFNHHTTKMHHSSSNPLPSEPLNLQSKTTPNSTLYQRHNTPYHSQRPSEKLRHDVGNAKVSKSEDRGNIRSNTNSTVGVKQVSNCHSSDKTQQVFEQKFHRPFELAPGKSAQDGALASSCIDANSCQHSNKKMNSRISMEEVPGKTDGSLQKSSHQHRLLHHPSHLPHQHRPLNSKGGQVFPSDNSSCNEKSNFPSNVPSTTISHLCPSKKKNDSTVSTGCNITDASHKSPNETPLNLALVRMTEGLQVSPVNHNCEANAKTDDSVSLVGSVAQFLQCSSVSKLDCEAAWRSSAKQLKILKNSSPLEFGNSSVKDGESKHDSCDIGDYEYEYEMKVTRLATIISGPKLSSLEADHEQMDFLSSLGLSTVQKCKDMEYEKHRRRKRQLRESSVSPTLLMEDNVGEMDDKHPSTYYDFTICTEDCPHNNGLDKRSLLGMLGLSYVGGSDSKDNYFLQGHCSSMRPENAAANDVLSLYAPLSYPLSNAHSHPSTFSYSPPFYSLYSSPHPSSQPFPSQYTYLSSQSSSAYSYYSTSSYPGYAINQTSSSSSSSSLSSSYHHHHHHHQHHLYNTLPVTSSKVTLSYPYHSNIQSCFDDHHLYYQQAKDDRIYPKMCPSSALDGSSYASYTNFDNQPFLDSSPGNMSGIMLERCISSTPASHRLNNCQEMTNSVDVKNTSPIENGVPGGGGDMNVFHWPGVDSVIESYHRYIEERAMEKQLLAESSTKLGKLNSQLLNARESLKNRISDLRKIQLELTEDRSLTQSQINFLKNFIMQLK